MLDDYIVRSKDKTDTDTLNYIPFIWEEQFKGSKLDDYGLRIRDQSSLPMIITTRKNYMATL